MTKVVDGFLGHQDTLKHRCTSADAFLLRSFAFYSFVPHKNLPEGRIELPTKGL